MVTVSGCCLYCETVFGFFCFLNFRFVLIFLNPMEIQKLLLDLALFLFAGFPLNYKNHFVNRWDSIESSTNAAVTNAKSIACSF